MEKFTILHITRQEVHKMNKETLQKELNELINQLNEEQIKRLIQLIEGMIGKAV